MYSSMDNDVTQGVSKNVNKLLKNLRNEDIITGKREQCMKVTHVGG